MADSTIRFTVQPKTIDASNNEVDYPQYTAENTFNNSIDNQYFIVKTIGTVNMSLLAKYNVIELHSDYPVKLTLNTATVLTDVYDVIISTSTAVTFSGTNKIENTGSNDATVTWRCYYKE